MANIFYSTGVAAFLAAASFIGYSAYEERAVEQAVVLTPIEQARNATVTLHDDKGRVGCSGIIVDTHYIVTNAHCVLDRHEVTVGFRGYEDTFPSTVIYRGTPDDVDVAVLRTNVAAPHAPPKVRCSDPKYGEEIVIIGHPFRQRYTTTWGRVSHQDMPRESKWFVDAAINPGNSGGPVLDMEGSLLAISTDMMAYHSGFGGPSGHTGISGVTALSAVCQDFVSIGVLNLEETS